ncbi:hypothetical protein [Streptomyces sp. NPDC056883]
MNDLLHAALPELLGGLGTAVVLLIGSAAQRTLRDRFKKPPAAE